MPRNAPGLGSVFTYQQGLQAGLTPDELRHAGWARPHHGVRGFSEPTTVLELAHDYRPRMSPEQYFSHATASISHRMWLPIVVEQRMEVHVAVPPGFRQPRGKRVRGHLLIDRPGGTVERDGLRVARPEEAWCQLATMLGLDDLVIAGESLLAKGRPDRLRLAVLAHAVAAGDRPRQSLLNRALPELREGSRSPKETELRRFLVASGCPEPCINMDIYDDFGVWVAECDLVYPQWKIAIEYEGDLHFRDPAQLRKDVHRYELLQALGWRIIRVSKDDLAFDREGLVARVQAAIAERSIGR
ncbi:endonuclease domain-containing protein [Amnibacterium sp.]|uniref:endonuclease domain-containing protein n=1 Tax=Amnibacterium sp. TaxID=1872496 RepID=UPI003F7BDE7B